MSRARAFGRLVARAQDEALRKRGSLREARTLLLSQVSVARGSAGATPRSSRWRLWTTVAGVLVAAGCALVLSRARTTSLTFEIGASESAERGGTARSGVAGEWIAAPARDELPLRFSDGSLVRLGPASRARVAEVTADGSRVLLESGAAHLHVVHRGHTRWTVQAGPFEVRVSGTEFDVTWDPAGEVFGLTLEEGRVTVSGCSMPEARAVSKGTSFRATCRDGEVAPVVLAPSVRRDSLGDPGAVAASSAPPVPSAAPVVQTLPVESLPKSAPSRAAPPRDSWRELLAVGRYSDAVDAVDAEGLSPICSTAAPGELMRLSDGERFTGHVDRAEFVLRELRRRFAADERASVAAFNLGRLAFDNRGSYAEAARWFQTYLEERPSGALAREALGRQMEALERGGDHAAATEVANRYLAAFPSGPHADVARSLAPR